MLCIIKIFKKTDIYIYNNNNIDNDIYIIYYKACMLKQLNHYNYDIYQSDVVG